MQQRPARRKMQSAKRRADLSADTLRLLDERVAEVVEEQRKRAEKLVKENRAVVTGLALGWRHRSGGLMTVQGSLALVRLKVVGVAAPAKPTALVEIRFLRN